MERGLVIDALENAVAASTGSLRGLLHHSNQGSQCASHDFGALLATIGIEPIISRRGNCWDNAAMESFWATLRAECFIRGITATCCQAHSIQFDCIETSDNQRRWHSSLDYLSQA
jgi:putative transposase